VPHRSFEKLLLQRLRIDEVSNKEMYYARFMRASTIPMPNAKHNSRNQSPQSEDGSGNCLSIRTFVALKPLLSLVLLDAVACAAASAVKENPMDTSLDMASGGYERLRQR
jgi:hypothetical protein